MSFIENNALVNHFIGDVEKEFGQPPFIQDSEEIVITTSKDVAKIVASKTMDIAAALVPKKVKSMKNAAVAAFKFATSIDTYENIQEIYKQKDFVKSFPGSVPTKYVRKARDIFAKTRDIGKEVVYGAVKSTVLVGIPVMGAVGKLATSAGMAPAEDYTLRSFSEGSVSVLTTVATGVGKATATVAPYAWDYAIKPAVKIAGHLAANYPGTTATVIASAVLMRKGYRNITVQPIKRKESFDEAQLVARDYKKPDWDQTLLGIGQISAGLGLIALNLGVRGYSILHPKDDGITTA